MTRLGSPDVVILRGVEDKAAYRAGLNNTVTARGLAHLLTKLARREVVSPRDSDAMLDILLGQELNEGIPEGLATETPFAHKTGWNDVAYHDAGVIDPYGPSPQVLVILTTGRGDMEAGGAFVAELARVLIGRG
jgi:beta-lactamase class A